MPCIYWPWVGWLYSWPVDASVVIIFWKSGLWSVIQSMLIVIAIVLRVEVRSTLFEAPVLCITIDLRSLHGIDLLTVLTLCIRWWRGEAISGLITRISIRKATRVRRSMSGLSSGATVLVCHILVEFVSRPGAFQARIVGGSIDE